MDQLAFFLSGSAVLLSTAPRVAPVVVWLSQCEACLKMRDAVWAIFGN